MTDDQEAEYTWNLTPGQEAAATDWQRRIEAADLTHALGVEVTPADVEAHENGMGAGAVHRGPEAPWGADARGATA